MGAERARDCTSRHTQDNQVQGDENEGTRPGSPGAQVARDSGKVKGPTTLIVRGWGNRVTQGREPASKRATPEEAAVLSAQCAPTDGHGAGSARSPRRGRRRQERAEAPPPAGARRAQANKAPLRISRPPLPPPAGPAPSLAPPLPPPRQSTPCVPHPVPASQAPGNLGGGVKGAVRSSRPDTPPHTCGQRSAAPPIQSPQSRKQRF